MNNFKYANSINCFSSSIQHLLSRNGENIEESQILLSKHLLQVFCKDPFDAIYSDMDLLIEDFLKRSHYKLIKLQINDLAKLSLLIQEYGIVLVNINCNSLSYAKLFATAKTKQNKHYILIDGFSKDAWHVIDTYVPGVYPKSFSGYIALNEEQLSGASFYILEKSSSLNRIEFVTTELSKIIANYLSIDNQCSYDAFIDNLSAVERSKFEVQTKKTILFEMSTAMSVSGLIALRGFWTNYLIDNGLCKHENYEKLISIPKLYNQVRLLLLKMSMKYNEDELKITKNMILDLFQLEKNIYMDIIVSGNR